MDEGNCIDSVTQRAERSALILPSSARILIVMDSSATYQHLAGASGLLDGMYKRRTGA